MPAAVSAAGDRPHILVYPFISSGHIIPLLDLTDRLISRGLAVTVLVTPLNLPLLEPLLSHHRPPVLDAIVVPAPEPSSPSSLHRIINKFRAMRDHHTPAILQWFAAHPNPPVAIISDFFLGWTNQLAIRLGIPRIVFSPSAAVALSVDFSLWRDVPKNPDQNPDYSLTLSDLPNSPSFPWWQLSSLYRNFAGGDSEFEFHRDGMVANIDSWGVIFNSFTELERPFLAHMEKKYFGSGRVWAVGPLLPPPPVDGSTAGLADRGGASSISAGELLAWLDQRQDHSVVYVCFGSRMVLSAEEAQALADALEASGVHFIWCVREDGANSGRPVVGGVVPEGFEDRTAERGLVIRGWAPQVMILRHRAVGSFLTHCGWNSVLEGLTAGVVMLTWPMGADQYTDAKLLVDTLGVGIRAHEGEDTPPDSIELARVLARSVEESLPQKARARKLKEAAAEAVSPNGSSDKDLDGLVKALRALHQPEKRKLAVVEAEEVTGGSLANEY